MSRRNALLVSAAATVAIAGGAAAYFGATRQHSKTVATPIVRIAATGSATEFLVSYHAGHGGGCGDPAGVTVRESSTAVVLTAHVRFTSGRGGRACPLDAVVKVDSVRLDRPLDGRSLVDGHGGRPLVVGRP